MSYIAYTYAKALEESFEHSPKEDFFKALETLKELKECFESLEVKNFFLSPVKPLSQKKAVLKKTLDSFEVQSLVSSFLFLLLEKKRWGELKEVLNCLLDRERHLKAEICVEVESSRPILEELKKELIKKLEASFKKKIIFKEKPIEKKLIGGLKIRAEGKAFDDTLKLHLKLMENQIRRNFYDYKSQ